MIPDTLAALAVPVGSLRPYSRNPRRGDLAAIRQSLEAHGLVMGGSKEEKIDHPTQKPLELYLRPLQNHLRKGEPFYEPFSGSGTALIAAENLGRRCYAVELDPRYVDVAVDRWQRHTGFEATRG